MTFRAAETVVCPPSGAGTPGGSARGGRDGATTGPLAETTEGETA